MAINKQIWIPMFIQAMFKEASFLKRGTDMSEFVDNNTINLAAAGVAPEVLYNNTTYPLTPAPLDDVAIGIPLATFTSTPTYVTDLQKHEYSFKKMETDTVRHRRAILGGYQSRAAHAWAPSSDSTDTPVIGTTGAVDAGGDRKRAKLANIIEAQLRCNKLDWPDEGRCLALSPDHLADLLLEDKDLLKNYLSRDANFVPLYGFELFLYSRMPFFDASSGAKISYAATPAGDQYQASLFFHKDSVMRAEGDLNMNVNERQVAYDGADLLNFNLRAVALPFKAEGIGAIISVE